MSRVVRLLALLLACAALVLAARPSLAQLGSTPPGPRRFPHTPSTPPPASGGPVHIRVTDADGQRGPVTLVPRSGGYIGELVVWNDGPGLMTVSRVALRGDDDDPRLPSHFTARFSDGGGGSGVIPGRSSKRITITWIPDREPKLHQALGHVVLTSNDEASGEVAMGFVVPQTGAMGFLTSHLLTLLLLLPFLVAVVAFAMRVTDYAGEEKLRGLTLLSTGGMCLLAIVLYQGFDGSVTRGDGNEGFQFVERSVLASSVGVEYYVGVDGANVAFVLLTALVGFAGAIAAHRVTADAGRRLTTFYGLYGLLLTGTMGVFVSLDLVLFTGSWAVMLGALTLLLFAGAAVTSRSAARKAALASALSTALLAFAVGALYLHSDPNYLGDGTRVAHTFALPELMRVAWNAKHLTLFGVSWVKAVWTLLFLAFAIAIPLAPLQRWFVDAVVLAPSPVGAVALAVVSKVGVYGLLRVSFGLLPDGSRWAATTLVAAGVLTIVVGGLLAVLQADVARMVAYAAVGQMGVCLVGLGGMTREGIAGCLVQAFSHGVVVAIAFVLVGALRSEPGTGDHASLRRFFRKRPFHATVLGVALLASTGLPGLPGFWGVAAALVGAFPVQRALVTTAALAGAVSAAMLFRTLHGAFRDDASPGERTEDDTAGEPRVSRELVAVLPLLALSVALGCFPAPLFTLLQGGVSDLNQLVNPPGPDEIARAPAPSGAHPG